VADLRGPWPAARGLGRRRALTAPAAAGALVRALTDRFPELADTLWTDEDTVEVVIDGARNVEVLQAVRDEPELRFWWLGDAAAVDYGPGGSDPHFEVVYHLYSDQHPAWLRIRARVDRANPHIPTITELWEGTMFHEREMYDMMGIVFDGNRDLRRIFMSPDYRSFPQRRDFILPDDAADSAAAGVNPLERPETWDLSAFRADLTDSTAATYAPTAERTGEEPEAEGGEALADKSRPR
jgi:NADH-quinone oxidoreductase subunit C